MALSRKRIQELHDKFIANTATEAEVQLLRDEFGYMFSAGGKVNEPLFNNFLVVSHRTYKKPVNGVVTIV